MTHTFLERSEPVPVVLTCVIKERIKEIVNWTTSVRKLFLTQYKIGLSPVRAGVVFHSYQNWYNVKKLFLLNLGFNECADSTQNYCHQHASCNDLPEGYSCKCKAGFKDIGNTPGVKCEGNLCIINFDWWRPLFEWVSKSKTKIITMANQSKAGWH